MRKKLYRNNYRDIIPLAINALRTEEGSVIILISGLIKELRLASKRIKFSGRVLIPGSFCISFLFGVSKRCFWKDFFLLRALLKTEQPLKLVVHFMDQRVHLR